MKIAVYAISKNEESNVSKFLSSIQDADSIYVTDTGSTDNTVALLKEAGIPMQEVCPSEEVPFRFDVARNFSLAFIPEDIDVCLFLDMDETISEGWRTHVEEAFVSTSTQSMTVDFVWSVDATNKPAVTYQQVKAHRRKNFTWKYPVHEVLSYTGEGQDVPYHCPEIRVFHSPDEAKERNYLPLLEIAIQEEPTNSRMLYYLAREYMYQGNTEDAVTVFKHHVSLDTDVWDEEQADSCRNLAKLEPARAEYWLLRNCSFTPNSRDSWVILAEYYVSILRYNEGFIMFQRALCVLSDNRNFIRNNKYWGAHIHLGMAKCAKALSKEFPSNLTAAEDQIEEAIKLEPMNPYVIAEYVNIKGILPPNMVYNK